MITKDEVLHIANIAMLKFSDEEVDVFTEKFQQVIDFVDAIKEVDTENVEPTFSINDDIEMLKDYEGDEVLTLEEVLRNTEEQEYGYFKILRVVE